MALVIGPDDVDAGGRITRLHQLAQAHVEGVGDTQRHGQRRVRALALDLAEHGATDAAGRRQMLQRPAALRPQLPNPTAHLIGCLQNRIIFRHNGNSLL